MNSRNSYDTRVKINYVLGLLDKTTKQLVNPSSARNWRQKGVDGILENYVTLSDDQLQYDPQMMADFASQQSLHKVMKFVWKVSIIIRKCSNSIHFKELFDNKDFIRQMIHIVENGSDMNKKLICRFLRITTNKFCAWKRSFRCKYSLKELCRLKAPHQLLDTEVKAIKSYMDNYFQKFNTKAAVFAKMVRDQRAFMSLTTFYAYARLLGYDNKQ